MIIIPPTPAVTNQRFQEEPFAFVEYDEHFIRHLQSGPREIGALVGLVKKNFPHRSSKQKKAIKTTIMRRLNLLVQRGTLRRIMRHLACLPNW